MPQVDLGRVLLSSAHDSSYPGPPLLPKGALKDDSRFDSLLLAVTEAASRRGMMRRLAAAALDAPIATHPQPRCAKKKKVTLCQEGQSLSVKRVTLLPMRDASHDGLTSPVPLVRAR